MSISMHSGRFRGPEKSDREHPPGGSARRGGRRANDSGFTPAEIIIGVILLAILSTAVIAQALKLRQQAQDSAAMATLRSAVSAARGVYSIVLPGGRNNFAADPAATAAAVNVTAARLKEKLEEQEPGIAFTDKTTFGKIKDRTPDVNVVWVDLPATNAKLAAAITSIDANPNGYSTGLRTALDVNTNIRAGDMIRLGLVAASGNSFCAILVQDSSNGQVSGIGYQSVNESATLAGFGADCGAVGALTSTGFKEMPNTPGTDPSLTGPSGEIKVDGTKAYGNGNAVKET